MTRISSIAAEKGRVRNMNSNKISTKYEVIGFGNAECEWYDSETDALLMAIREVEENGCTGAVIHEHISADWDNYDSEGVEIYCIIAPSDDAPSLGETIGRATTWRDYIRMVMFGCSSIGEFENWEDKELYVDYAVKEILADQERHAKHDFLVTDSPVVQEGSGSTVCDWPIITTRALREMVEDVYDEEVECYRIEIGEVDE